MRVEKMVAFYHVARPRRSTSRCTTRRAVVGRYPDFDEALRAPRARLGRAVATRATSSVPATTRVQLLLRLHISHLLQVCSRHTADHDAGVPARGLNGEAYRGHVFWDELYVYPFLNFRLPEITRELLMYRYRRLGEARAAARAGGLPGRDVPVAERQRRQGGDPGRPPQPAVGPLGAGPQPQPAPRQRGDLLQRLAATTRRPTTVDFLRDYGAEMMLEIARFWASIAHFNPERERYEIHGVMGPDEFHEKYPGADEGGLRNNAYTNVMVAWICETRRRGARPAARAAGARRCASELGLTDEEIGDWEDMSRRMFVPFHDDGIISQFEGYEDLEELDWDALPREATATSSASTGSCAPRATTPTATSSPSRPTR